MTIVPPRLSEARPVNEEPVSADAQLQQPGENGSLRKGRVCESLPISPPQVFIVDCPGKEDKAS